jgi:DNA-binding MarR family transcriptional regulator
MSKDDRYTAGSGGRDETPSRVVRELYVLRDAQRTALHVVHPGAASMTLTQLRYIVAIADAGLNITLAADNVHATQSGISKQLKQLEGELGF